MTDDFRSVLDSVRYSLTPLELTGGGNFNKSTSVRAHPKG